MRRAGRAPATHAPFGLAADLVEGVGDLPEGAGEDRLQQFREEVVARERDRLQVGEAEQGLKAQAWGRPNLRTSAWKRGSERRRSKIGMQPM